MTKIRSKHAETFPHFSTASLHSKWNRTRLPLTKTELQVASRVAGQLKTSSTIHLTFSGKMSGLCSPQNCTNDNFVESNLNILCNIMNTLHVIISFLKMMTSSQCHVVYINFHNYFKKLFFLLWFCIGCSDKHLLKSFYNWKNLPLDISCTIWIFATSKTIIQ